MMNTHSFFWKYSRDGTYSKTYASLIIDVPGRDIQKNDNKITFTTSPDILLKIILLLQDGEIMNKNNGERSAGLTKQAYIYAVNLCGFRPPEFFKEMRGDMVCGKAQMGRHMGPPLDWGFYEVKIMDTISIDVSDFQPALDVPADTGVHNKSGGRDLLSCYRTHEKFIPSGNYWDLMPKHIHIAFLYAMIKRHIPNAEELIENVLGWKSLK